MAESLLSQNLYLRMRDDKEHVNPEKKEGENVFGERPHSKIMGEIYM